MKHCQEKALSARTSKLSFWGEDTYFDYMCEERPATLKMYIPNTELSSETIEKMEKEATSSLEKYCATCPLYNR